MILNKSLLFGTGLILLINNYDSSNNSRNLNKFNEEMFKIIDKDEKNYITLEDIKIFANNQTIFNLIDRNEDGYIRLAEFNKYISKIIKLNFFKRLYIRHKFYSFDLDKNKKIDSEELEKFLNHYNIYYHEFIEQFVEFSEERKINKIYYSDFIEFINLYIKYINK